MPANWIFQKARQRTLEDHDGVYARRLTDHLATKLPEYFEALKAQIKSDIAEFNALLGPADDRAYVERLEDGSILVHAQATVEVSLADRLIDLRFYGVPGAQSGILLLVVDRRGIARYQSDDGRFLDVHGASEYAIGRILYANHPSYVAPPAVRGADDESGKLKLAGNRPKYFTGNG